MKKYMIPMTTCVASNLLTSRAAARHMLTQHSGVVIFLTGTPSKGVAPGLAAAGTAFGAVEGIVKSLIGLRYKDQRMDIQNISIDIHIVLNMQS